MMATVYMIIVITPITIAAGLSQNCLQYCKSSHHKTVVLPECECSLNNTPSSLPTTLSLATPKPIKDNEIYYEPVEPNSYQNTHFDDQTLSMLNFNINLHSKPSTRSATETNEYLRTAKYEIEKARELPLLLYLDLDLNTAGNNNIQLENLKKMFINFHATEKDLSECINLHIYIFSKSIDKNTAVDSQKITEIQNKCKHTDSIIKESIYQINHTLSQILQRKYEDDTSGVNFSDNTQGPSLYMETISTTDDYTRTQNTESMYEKSTETMQTTTDIDYTLRLPQNTKTAHVTEIVPEKSDMKTNRSTITDEEVKIPKIITKELSNGSLISNVEGYEDISNSYFETTTDITTTENSVSIDSNIDDKIIQSGLIELHGRLYFSFGSIQIPARFIQHTDGELNIALDALSMCKLMLDKDKSNFLNLLCKSIKLQNLD